MNFFDVDAQRRGEGLFAYGLGAVFRLLRHISTACAVTRRWATGLGLDALSGDDARAIPVIVDVIETLGVE